VVVTVAIDERTAAKLADAMRGRSSHDVTVVGVETELRFDRDGDEYLLVELVLSAPTAGSETWPVDDTVQLRAEARDEAARLGLGSQVRLSIRTAGDSQTADNATDPPVHSRRHVGVEEPDTAE
jgi:hypothetical protein